jgi:AAA+ ATPase superfamily predicted ATPase
VRLYRPDRPEPFVDRDAELAWLRRGWGAGRPELRVLYGRRRVGKSALLDRFADGLPAVVYQAVEGTSADHLRDLTAELLAAEGDPLLEAAPLANWAAALAYIAARARRGPLLFVFDEYQYAAEADPALASLFQRWWSREIEGPGLPLYLVLCGSYVRFFVRNVLTGPMYGRNTGVWRLDPLAYPEAGRFFPGWSPEDRVRAWAVLGGVPHYLKRFDPTRGLTWNVAHNVLARGASLYAEGELLTREELRDPRTYFSVLRAIDDGCTTNGKIENRVRGGREGGNITYYLDTLRELGFLDHRKPVVGASGRGIWEIADPYLRFWFRFVLPNRRRLDRSADPERDYQELVAPQLDHFVSKPAFEEVCREWVRRRAARAALPLVDAVGSWWGQIPAPSVDSPRRQKSAELEVVAVRGGRVVLAGEAKWSTAPVGFATLNHLREVLPHVPGADASTPLVLFGRRFDPRLRERAGDEGVTLVGPDDLYV